MQSLWISKQFKYDGSQLRSLFSYLEHGVLGDSIVAWRGPCEVSLDHMIDGEDLRVESQIAGADMVHFIIEVFHVSLPLMVAYQRLFTDIVLSSFIEMGGDAAAYRSGDDIYIEDGKLNISVATVSPNSGLIHCAVNVTTEGTPVKTYALNLNNIDAKQFAEVTMARWCDEFHSMQDAARKVRPV